MNQDDRSPETQAEKRLALALSGGGLRASLFNYGVLKRLHELGLLKQAGVVSATSGGAITAALFHSHISGIDESGLKYDWEKFEEKLIRICRRGLMHHFAFSVLLYVSVLACAICFGFWGLEAAMLPGILAMVLYIYLFSAALRSTLAVRQKRLRWRKLSGQTFAVPSGLSAYSTSALRPFQPSMMRIVTLGLDVFDNNLFCTFSTTPLLCLNVVDLVTGKQRVFSSRVLAELTEGGLTDLWDRQASGDWEWDKWHLPIGSPIFKRSYDVQATEVALGVAASSAFPPVFSPVTFYEKGSIEGILIDGGVLDNLALNVLMDLDRCISDRRQKYDLSIGGSKAYKDVIGHVLVADAGARFKRSSRTVYLRSQLALRLVDVFMGHQNTESDRKNWVMQNSTESEVGFVGLFTGLPEECCGAHDGQWGPVLGAIRTHLDAFSEEEIGALSFAGYAWAEYFASQVLGHVNDVAFRPLSSFLPGVDLGSDREREMLDRIQKSNGKVAVVRFLRTLFAR